MECRIETFADIAIAEKQGRAGGRVFESESIGAERNASRQIAQAERTGGLKPGAILFSTKRIPVRRDNESAVLDSSNRTDRHAGWYRRGTSDALTEPRWAAVLGGQQSTPNGGTPVCQEASGKFSAKNLCTPFSIVGLSASSSRPRRIETSTF